MLLTIETQSERDIMSFETKRFALLLHRSYKRRHVFEKPHATLAKAKELVKSEPELDKLAKRIINDIETTTEARLKDKTLLLGDLALNTGSKYIYGLVANSLITYYMVNAQVKTIKFDRVDLQVMYDYLVSGGVRYYYKKFAESRKPLI